MIINDEYGDKFVLNDSLSITIESIYHQSKGEFDS